AASQRGPPRRVSQEVLGEAGEVEHAMGREDLLGRLALLAVSAGPSAPTASALRLLHEQARRLLHVLERLDREIGTHRSTSVHTWCGKQSSADGGPSGGSSTTTRRRPPIASAALPSVSRKRS